MAGGSWIREWFVVGREVGDVLHVEQQLLVDESGAGEFLADAQGGVVADVVAQIREQDFVAADGGAAVVIGGFADGVEGLLAIDHRESIVEQAGIAHGVGLVIAGQRRQHERVVGDRLGPVRLGRVFRGGAAAERGHDEQHQGEQRGHEDRAAEVLQGGAPARGEQSRRIATGVRIFDGVAGILAESGTLQCAIGHGTPSLVFLRSGGVHYLPCALIWWPRNLSRGDVLSVAPRGQRPVRIPLPA